MKRLITAALALTLMSGASALAQQSSGPHSGQHTGGGGGGGHPAGGGGGGGGGGHPGGGAPAGGSHAGPQGGASHAGAPAGFVPGPHQGGTQGNVHAYSGGGGGGGHGGGSPAGPGGGGQFVAPQGGGPAGFQGRSGTAGRGSGVGAPQGGARGRFDPGRFPRVVQPSRQFEWRGRAWVGQPGYYYRHWGYGDRLPYGWFSSRWYITDYYDYDLPAPPYDYMWVRVGPDALLVDIYTGQVVEAEYGVFY